MLARSRCRKCSGNTRKTLFYLDPPFQTGSNPLLAFLSSLSSPRAYLLLHPSFHVAFDYHRPCTNTSIRKLSGGPFIGRHPPPPSVKTWLLPRNASMPCNGLFITCRAVCALVHGPSNTLPSIRQPTEQPLLKCHILGVKTVILPMRLHWPMRTLLYIVSLYMKAVAEYSCHEELCRAPMVTKNAPLSPSVGGTRQVMNDSKGVPKAAIVAVFGNSHHNLQSSNAKVIVTLQERI